MAPPEYTDPAAAEAAHPAPSTYDAIYVMPGIAGGQDTTLIILESARARYAALPVGGAYISVKTSGGGVCAAGALVAADTHGDQKREGELAIGMANNAAYTWEKHVSDAAKEALQLVNEAAAELFADEYEVIRDWIKDGKRGSCGSWHFGPIEFLNQELSWSSYYGEEREAPAAVLRSYDLAIEKRKQMVLA